MYTISDVASQEEFLRHWKKRVGECLGGLISFDAFSEARQTKFDVEWVSPLADVQRSGGILDSGDRGLIAAPGPRLAFLCVPVGKRTMGSR